MSHIQSFEIPKIHPAGYPFVAIAAAVWAMLAWALGATGFWVGLILAAWVVFFFRDPTRVTPTRDGLFISPADGKVLMCVKAVPPAELEMGDAPLTRISIFLNVFDVHINRVPIDGEIVKTHYRPGLFINASLDKASEDNERMAIRQRLADGREIAYVQIAGLVARRIICTAVAGQKVKAGERFGLIRFGSRTDLYLPDGVVPLVIPGQKVIGGETVLADLTSQEPERVGEVR
jgi:phosphatidylserine decarboxylase